MDDALGVGLATGAATVEHIGLAMLIGVLAGCRWLPLGDAPWRRDTRRRLQSFGWFGLGAMVLGGAARLWFAAAAMSDEPLAASGSALVALVRASHYGHAWLAGVPFALIAAAGLLRLKSGAARRPALLALGCAGYAYGLSVVSHAASQGDFDLPVILDWLHVLFTSLWVGAVLTAGFAVLAMNPKPETPHRQALASYVSSLSTGATIALLGVVATGVLKAWSMFETPAALLQSASGQVLMLKLLWVTVAVALGASNRFVFMPPLIDETAVSGSDRLIAHVRRFKTVLQVEACVLLAALATAALLGSLPPP